VIYDNFLWLLFSKGVRIFLQLVHAFLISLPAYNKPNNSVSALLKPQCACQSS